MRKAILAGKLFTGNPEQPWFSRVFLGIESGKFIECIEDIPDEVLREKRAGYSEFIDLSQDIVLPPLVNGHTHLAMSLLRGIGDDLSFHDWLFNRILPLEDKILSSEYVELGTELAAAECIRLGTGYVNDSYHLPEVTARVLDRMGLPGRVSAPVTDRFLDYLDSGRFSQFRDGIMANPSVEFGITPHAPYTCSDKTLQRSRDIAMQWGCPIHIHVSETSHEIERSLCDYGVSPIERLERLGLFEVPTIMAHAIHLSEKDLDILAKYPHVSVIHNPDSNLRLGAGLAPLKKILDRGIQVGLGTDGAASANDLSMFGTLDLTSKIQKLLCAPHVGITNRTTLLLGTSLGAVAVASSLTSGIIAEGQPASLISVRTKFAHQNPLIFPESTLVTATLGLEVATSLINGRVLLKDFEYTEIDIERIIHRSREFLNTKIIPYI